MVDEENNNPAPKANDNSGNPGLFSDNLEAIKMLKKQFTPEQLVQFLRNFPEPLLKSMPNMEGVDPAMLKSITVEQVQMLYDSVN